MESRRDMGFNFFRNQPSKACHTIGNTSTPRKVSVRKSSLIWREKNQTVDSSLIFCAGGKLLKWPLFPPKMCCPDGCSALVPKAKR